MESWIRRVCIICTGASASYAVVMLVYGYTYEDDTVMYARKYWYVRIDLCRVHGHAGDSELSAMHECSCTHGYVPYGMHE